MTIRSRFLTVSVLVTVLMGLVGACSWVILERIHHDFIQFVDDTAPILHTLERVRLGGLRIVASTSEFGFILAEKAHITDTADIAYGEADEQTLIDEGTQLYTQAMERYTDLIARSSPTNVERLGRIRQAARRLQATSHAIISLKQQGRTGEEVLQLKAEFEDQERSFLAAVDDAMMSEDDIVKAHKRDIYGRIAISRTIVLLTGGLTLIIALVMGLRLARAILTPLKRLTEATGAVGRGQFATRLPVTSEDELGHLAMAFNGMGEELARIDGERTQAEAALRDSHQTLERQVEARTAALQRMNAQLQAEMAERMQAEAVLRESEAIHRTTLSNISDTVFITDDAGIFTFVCPNVDIIFGYADHEVRQLGTIVQLLGDVLCNSEDLDAMGEIQNVERNVTDKNGNPHVLLVNLKRVSINEGTRLYVCRDITERKQAEEALSQSEIRIQTILDTAVDGIISMTEQGLILSFNPAAERLFGYAAEEVRGQNIKVLMPAPYQERNDDYLANYLRTGEKKVIGIGREVGGRRKDGATFPMDVSVGEACLGDQRLFTGIVRDITKRKEAQAALNARSRQQAMIATLGQRALAGEDLDVLMDDAVALIAETLDVEYCKILERLPDGKTLWLRAGVGWQEGLVGAATVGVERDSQAGYTLFSDEPVIVEDLRTDPRFSGPKLLHDHHVVSGISVIIAGQDQPLGVLGAHTTRHQPFSRDDISFIQAVANVLAEAITRQQTEAALEHERDFAKSLVDTAPVIILVMDTEGRILQINPYMEELSGYRLEEVRGKEWFTTFLPEQDQETVSAVFRQGVQTGERGIQVNPIVTKEGRERLIEWHSKALIEASDATTARLAIGLDITERQQAEAALRQADRLAAIGEVVTSVAHGIRNPLANIRAAAQVAVLDCHEDNASALISRNLRNIMAEVDRMDGRLLELLQFVRPIERQNQPVDLNAALRGALHLLDGRLQRDALKVETCLAPALPPIMAEVLVLEEIFLSLIANAIDVVYDSGGTITFTTGTLPDETGALRVFAEVRDTGTGVPADEMEQIFEPFYTTKSRGTGLGLAIARKFTEAYDGVITVESQPGKGSCFRVMFPECQES